jgi:hypothetical protein
MNRRPIYLVGVFILALATCGLASAQTTRPSPSAALAIKACQQIKALTYVTTDYFVLSPDGASIVCVKEDREDENYTYTSVYVSRGAQLNRVRVYGDIGPSGANSIAWSPDSRRFTFTYTTTGAVGQFRIDVFNARTLRSRPVSLPVRRLAIRGTKCRLDPYDVNAYIVKWLNPGSAVVYTDMHPLTTDCRKDLDKTGTYAIAIPSGRVLKQYQGEDHDKLEKEFYGQ